VLKIGCSLQGRKENDKMKETVLSHSTREYENCKDDSE
jgi:hypothetical protein